MSDSTTTTATAENNPAPRASKPVLPQNSEQDAMEQEDDVDELEQLVRPRIYPRGKHLPTERRTVLEEYYGGRIGELQILTELKSHQLVSLSQTLSSMNNNLQRKEGSFCFYQGVANYFSSLVAKRAILTRILLLTLVLFFFFITFS